MKKIRLVLILLLVIVILLILPLIFKDKGYTLMHGPDLSELSYTDVFYTNEDENIKLAGMLFLPDEEGSFPVAILIHGSGPSKRNSVWYLSVTKYLQENGIAVLLPDKRGCEKSEGEWIGANFKELATDVISAVEFVKKQDQFQYSEIGIIGMSQGGWIAPIAAKNSNDISFVACISGATVSTDEQLLHEEINNIAPYTYKFIARMIAPLTVKKIKKSKTFSPFRGFDPIPYWEKIKIPVFLAYGENDKNVPVNACIERLKENELDNFYIKTYPEGGHGIVDKEISEMSQKYLVDLVAFIREQ